MSVETSVGEFRVELHPDKAPRTVEAFLGYVDDGWYDGTVVHQVSPSFTVQAGAFGPGLREKAPTRPPVPSEAGNWLSNLAGTVAVARLSPAESWTTPFAVNVADNSKALDTDPARGRPGYTVFGRVVAGMDVVDRIGRVRTKVAPGKTKFNVPVEEVTIVSVKRVPDAAPKQTDPLPPRPNSVQALLILA